MAEALYRKYRPVTFKDVVGQEHIERTLRNAIEQDKVSHAYLFCGPRGTGKTTTARILAKALLCEKGPTIDPDGTCSECLAIASGTHPDVYELDAASRTGVENVREEIISRVNYAPTRGTYKVYIIDEVHMLSPAAFNALLKTLEEPPAHVVFILCTTDPQKVPETIQSRCQRFDFHRIATEAIVARLGAICMAEGVEFEGEALDLIAHRADGGMRNALTTLEQLIAFGEGTVTFEGAQNLLGSLDNTDLAEIVNAIGTRDAAACFTWVAHYVETGADLAQFVRDLAEYMRNLYLMSMAGADVEIEVSDAARTVMAQELKYYGQDRLNRILVVLGDVIKDLRTSSNPRLTFEIALARMVRPESDLTIEALAERVEALEALVKAGYAQPTTPAPQQIAASFEPAQQRSVSVQSPASASVSQQVTAPSPEREVVSASADASMQNQAATEPSVAPVSAPAYTAAPSPRPAQEQQSYSASVLSASVDLANPAAVQRLWHAITTALRKENPARGVLFMNAKVSSDTQQTGLLIEFSSDNSFAYTAAQKKEVQQLLAQTIERVAGGAVPYRLAIAAGGKKAPATSRTASGSPVTSPEPAKPAAPVAPATPAVPAASRTVSTDLHPVSTPSAPASSAPATPTASASSQTTSAAPSQAASAAPSQVTSAAPAPIEDQVPLDVYDSFAAPAQSMVEQPTPQSTAMPDRTAQQSQPVASQVSQHAGAAVEPSVQLAQQSSTEAAQNEEERIKALLTNSFGEGIKFEDIE